MKKKKKKLVYDETLPLTLRPMIQSRDSKSGRTRVELKVLLAI